jgi:hypothetical protein
MTIVLGGMVYAVVLSMNLMLACRFLWDVGANIMLGKLNHRCISTNLKADTLAYALLACIDLHDAYCSPS